MSLAATRVIASRTLVRKATVQQQKRGFIDYLTNYPDKVAEMRKIQCAGGTMQGEANPTWLKQPQDKAVAAVGLALFTLGMGRAVVGLYRLATGKGKIED
eukprot:CAMPEP_0170211308 /NCGR_PEP_ID=MMETSP0116_2-20130129/5270_1 /TAXON_ID=400756 /ORGANISM="Durinskia baltica, Strain CSIRO CS-38" /LENGTH=99 /DNA_ID=CAMNT_0010461843 /DNA_START=61 /DNA_END=360 /DNA_ORIENTATION=+